MFNLIFPLVLLAALTTMIVVSLGYQYTAKLFPLLVMLPVAALLVVQIFLEARKLRQETAPRESTQAGQADLFSYLKSQGWVVVLLLSIYLLGFVIGPALFLLIYLRMQGVKWLTTAICIAMAMAIVYGAFGLLFEVYLYEGLLFSYL